MTDKEQIAKLRAALMFYADADNYKSDGLNAVELGTESMRYKVAAVDIDFGAKARSALAAIKD